MQQTELLASQIICSTVKGAVVSRRN